MTSRKLSVISLILMVLGCVGLAQAQQKLPAENVPAGNAALREKAFALLESLASQVGTLQSAENRARLGSNIAASLWDHNETRARGLVDGLSKRSSSGFKLNQSPGRFRL